MKDGTLVEAGMTAHLENDNQEEGSGAVGAHQHLAIRDKCHWAKAWNSTSLRMGSCVLW